MSADATTAADIVARRLADAGCRFAFGIPGGEVLALMDALDRAGIDFVLVKHENAGGFMAEGTHHADGAPGILVATVGPGVANAVNVVANAQQDRVPLIFLTGRIDPAQCESYTHQVFDHAAVLRPIVKASFTLDPAAAAVQIDKAIALATDYPQGPVHIDVPIAVATATETSPTRPRRAPVAPAAPAPGPLLDRARALVAEARRPLILAGLEAVQQNAGPALHEAARRLGAPVVTTYKGKGLIPETDALSLGGAGLSPTADGVLMPLIAQADLLLLVGYDPIEMRAGWTNAWSPATKNVIEISATPNVHYVHQSSIQFVGDIAASLDVLTRERASPAPGMEAEVARARHALREAYRIDEEWGPAAICEVASDRLPSEGVATVDTGAHRILLSQVWTAKRPHALLQSTGLCTMGCALPLAAGVKLAAPERPVVAMTGDGSLEMIVGELATLRDRRIAIPIVVFVDGSLALIEMKQRGSNLANLGVDMGVTDFAALARAMGGFGVDVRSRGELAAALDAAFAADRFTVIAAHIPRGAYDGRL